MRPTSMREGGGRRSRRTFPLRSRARLSRAREPRGVSAIKRRARGGGHRKKGRRRRDREARAGSENERSCFFVAARRISLKASGFVLSQARELPRRESKLRRARASASLSDMSRLKWWKARRIE